MHGEPFTAEDARRVIKHPDTPAAYVEWVELLPLTGAHDRTHLGNVLGWSHARARLPLGSSRSVFEKAFPGIDEELLDEWMANLARTPIADFLDHHVPFVRNVASMGGGQALDDLLQTW